MQFKSKFIYFFFLSEQYIYWCDWGIESFLLFILFGFNLPCFSFFVVWNYITNIGCRYIYISLRTFLFIKMHWLSLSFIFDLKSSLSDINMTIVKMKTSFPQSLSEDRIYHHTFYWPVSFFSKKYFDCKVSFMYDGSTFSSCYQTDMFIIQIYHTINYVNNCSIST